MSWQTIDASGRLISVGEAGADGADGVDGFTIATINFVIPGGGVAITTGEKGHFMIEDSGDITQVTLLGLTGESGSIIIDLWKDSYANHAPTDADSITASAPPTITSSNKSQDSTLTGWTTNVTAGDIFTVNVDSITDLTQVTLVLKISKS